MATPLDLLGNAHDGSDYEGSDDGYCTDDRTPEPEEILEQGGETIPIQGLMVLDASKEQIRPGGRVKKPFYLSGSGVTLLVKDTNELASTIQYLYELAQESVPNAPTDKAIIRVSGPEGTFKYIFEGTDDPEEIISCKTLDEANAKVWANWILGNFKMSESDNISEETTEDNGNKPSAPPTRATAVTLLVRDSVGQPTTITESEFTSDTYRLILGENRASRLLDTWEEAVELAEKFNATNKAEMPSMTLTHGAKDKLSDLHTESAGAPVPEAPQTFVQPGKGNYLGVVEGANPRVPKDANEAQAGKPTIKMGHVGADDVTVVAGCLEDLDKGKISPIVGLGLSATHPKIFAYCMKMVVDPSKKVLLNDMFNAKYVVRVSNPNEVLAEGAEEKPTVSSLWAEEKRHLTTNRPTSAGALQEVAVSEPNANDVEDDPYSSDEDLEPEGPRTAEVASEWKRAMQAGAHFVPTAPLIPPTGTKGLYGPIGYLYGATIRCKRSNRSKKAQKASEEEQVHMLFLDCSEDGSLEEVTYVCARDELDELYGRPYQYPVSDLFSDPNWEGIRPVFKRTMAEYDEANHRGTMLGMSEGLAQQLLEIGIKNLTTDTGPWWENTLRREDIRAAGVWKSKRYEVPDEAVTLGQSFQDLPHWGWSTKTKVEVAAMLSQTIESINRTQSKDVLAALLQVQDADASTSKALLEHVLTQTEIRADRTSTPKKGKDKDEEVLLVIEWAVSTVKAEAVLWYIALVKWRSHNKSLNSRGLDAVMNRIDTLLGTTETGSKRQDSPNLASAIEGVLTVLGMGVTHALATTERDIRKNKPGAITIELVMKLGAAQTRAGTSNLSQVSSLSGLPLDEQRAQIGVGPLSLRSMYLRGDYEGLHIVSGLIDPAFNRALTPVTASPVLGNPMIDKGKVVVPVHLSTTVVEGSGLNIPSIWGKASTILRTVGDFLVAKWLLSQQWFLAGLIISGVVSVVSNSAGTKAKLRVRVQYEKCPWGTLRTALEQITELSSKTNRYDTPLIVPFSFLRVMDGMAVLLTSTETHTIKSVDSQYARCLEVDQERIHEIQEYIRTMNPGLYENEEVLERTTKWLLVSEAAKPGLGLGLPYKARLDTMAERVARAEVEMFTRPVMTPEASFLELMVTNEETNLETFLVPIWLVWAEDGPTDLAYALKRSGMKLTDLRVEMEAMTVSLASPEFKLEKIKSSGKFARVISKVNKVTLSEDKTTLSVNSDDTGVIFKGDWVRSFERWMINPTPEIADTMSKALVAVTARTRPVEKNYYAFILDKVQDACFRENSEHKRDMRRLHDYMSTNWGKLLKDGGSVPETATEASPTRQFLRILLGSGTRSLATGCEGLLDVLVPGCIPTHPQFLYDGHEAARRSAAFAMMMS